MQQVCTKLELIAEYSKLNKPHFEVGFMICNGVKCKNCSAKYLCFDNPGINSPITTKDLKMAKWELPELFI